ncbi:sugar transferase [Dactylosporangium sp. NBC_01737]|uniref:sugar transferase n=1 Tax=Dactylosporangium sp. NBC_01737 TaxID=2975959 RepID=UPI002E168580|nr:sugar transferase [Dactylosporangium sp. NBC_01737]
MSNDVAAVPKRERPGVRVPAAGIVTRRTSAPEPIRRTRGAGTGEPWRLAGADVAVFVALWLAAGATWPAALACAAFTAAALAGIGLYRPRLHLSVLDDLPRMLLGFGAVTPVAAWFTLPTTTFEAAVVVWPLVVLAATVPARTLVYVMLYQRRRLLPGDRALIVGSGDLALRLAEVLRADPAYGIRPIGLVGPPALTGESLPVPLLGPVDELAGITALHRPDCVIVAFPNAPDTDLIGVIRQWRRCGVTVYVVPRLFELAVPSGGAELVQGIALERMRPDRMRGLYAAAKRAIDVTGAAIGLALAGPVLLACAIAVRLESGRAGVLFRQQRIGRDGKPFTILKFRSLTPATDRESQVRWNINTDDRVGPVGRLLRSTSLDELPQLINVLRGDMSLVGPRPERPYFVEQFARTYGGYADRHRVAAGITGWAQIHGLRGDTSIADRVRYDNYYIENWSVALDVKIMVRTVGAMLGLSRRWR